MRTTLALAVLVATAFTPPARAQCTPTEVGTFGPPAGNSSGWGTNVGLSGDTAVMGDSGADGQEPLSGLALVYERDLGGPNAWSLAAKISGSDTVAYDAFGSGSDVSGDTLAVGAYLAGGAIPHSGAAYLFERDLGGAGNWGESAKVTASDPAPNTNYGGLLLLEGDRLFVAASGATGASAVTGAIYVYERNLGGPQAWGERKKVFASGGAVGDGFGTSLAVSGDTLVVGAYAATSNSGVAYVFERDLGGPGNWGEVAKLTASNGHGGALFGWSVGIDGDTIAVGSIFNNQFGTLSGAAYIFERDEGGPDAWGEVTGLIGSDHSAFYRFGYTVGVVGDTVIVSALPTPAYGKYYLFHRNEGGAGQWGEVAIIQKIPTTSNSFGSRLDTDGPTFVAGLFDDEMVVYEGPTSTTPVTYCTAGTSASGCRAQISVAGTPSATAPTGFFLRAAGVEGEKDGLFFFASNGRQANPWGNGTSYQCVVPPVRRAGVLSGTGINGQCDGSFSQDLNARWAAKPGHNPGAGAIVQAQLWYRDPFNTSTQTTSLSDAIEFSVCQ